MNVINEKVIRHRAEMLERLARLVAIRSVESEPLSDAPFGQGPRDALKEALEMASADGFHTADLDHYCGYAEMGEGEQVIGIIAHLDVVPAVQADGWDTDPFTMTEKAGRLYGRGVSDDKGAAVAALTAMKVLRDLGVPLNKRIRLILGTNEETGSRGLLYYVKKEGSVDYGFTPDGSFPGIYGEKGYAAAVYRSKKTVIMDIHGGTATNVVCPKCTVTVPKCSFSPRALGDYFNNCGMAYEIQTGEDSDTITLVGRSAHASTPELGRNAISYLLVGLQQAGFQDPFTEFYCRHFGLATDGEGIGAKCHDEYGALTLNTGMIAMHEGVIEGTIDIRFPVTMNTRQVAGMVEGHLEDDGGIIENWHMGESLFFPPDSPLVLALHKAYIKVTGDTENQPFTMGGGTYAKEMANTIAFGCGFPGVSYHIHEANEEVSIDELLLQTEIYVQALLNLLAL